VPHQQPIRRTGQPMGDNKAELAFGSPTVGELGSPVEAAGANAGIVLPRWQFDGALRIQTSPNFDIGFVFDYGLDKGSEGINTDQPDPDNGDVIGAGVSTQYSIKLDDKFQLGLAAEFLIYSIPYVEYRTCVSNCLGLQFTTIQKDRDSIPVVSFGIIPSWKPSDHNIVLFAGFNVRNHPTIEKGDVEIGPDLFDEDVEPGPSNVVVTAGIEFSFSNGVRGMAYIYQEVVRDPVVYRPTLGLAISIPLAKMPPPIPQPPSPVYY